MMRRRKIAVACSATFAVLMAGCTIEEPDPPEPTPSKFVEKYDAIPYDPCAVIDLSGAEALLGPLEYDDYFNSGDDEPDSMQGWGETWCGAAFDDSTNQAADLVIRVYIEDEAVGEATDQEGGPGDGLHWPYASDYVDRPDEIPDRVPLSVETQWESFEVGQFPEVRNDKLGWDPEGKSLAVFGVFAESNVWLYAYIWREGTGASAPPDPGLYADLIADLADQVRGQLEVNEFYEGD